MTHSRRDFLKASAACAVGSMFTPVSPLFTSAAQALPTTVNGKTLITVFLRGGADGIQLLPPTGEDVPPEQVDAYLSLRPTNSLDDNIGFLPWSHRTGGEDPAVTPISLDGFFEIHPAMAPLHSLYTSGEIAFFPGVAGQGSTSHFVAQDAIEWAMPANGPTVKTTGWMHDALNTYYGTLPSGLIAGGVAFGAELPKAFSGTAQRKNILTIGDLDVFSIDISNNKRNLVEQIFQRNPARYSGIKNKVLDNFNFLDTLGPGSSVDTSAYHESVRTTEFVQSLAGVKTLMDQGMAPSFINIDLGGWDTHGGEWNKYFYRLNILSQGIRGFWDQLTAAEQDNTIFLVMTEFGRTLDMNGQYGSDHGNASTWMTIGKNLNGGIYSSEWKGLPRAERNTDGTISGFSATAGYPDALRISGNRAHLQTSTDFRSILYSVLREFVGVIDDDEMRPIFGISEGAEFGFEGISGLFN